MVLTDNDCTVIADKSHLEFPYYGTSFDEKCIGVFKGIEPFRRNTIVLSDGDFCPELGLPISGHLTMHCGVSKDLIVREISTCVYQADFYDDNPSCSELKDHMW